MSPSDGELVSDRYRMEGEPFDSGGLGVVFRAVDVMARFGDPEQVVVKRLRPEALTSQSTVSRFRREIRIGSGIVHPNVLRVLDFGQDENGDWYVAEFASGGSLAHFVPQGGLDADGVLRVLRDVVAGLQHLHARGTVHRDLTPGNVLLLRDTWVLADFGLSVSEEIRGTQQTETDVANFGTPDYVAPEQRDHLRDATLLSDVFALGKLIQFLSEGQRPSASPQVSNPLRSVILRATSENPAHRFQSAAELMAAVEIELATPPNDSESNADRAGRYSAGMARQTPSADVAAEIVIWLASLDPGESPNVRHLLRVFSSASPEALLAMWNEDPEAYRLAVRNLAIAVESQRGRLDFDKVDAVGYALVRVDSAACDPDVRHRILRALAVLSASHRRFACRRALVQVLHATPPGELVQPTITALRETGEAPWLFEENDPDEFGPHLRPWLRDLLR